MRTTSAGRSSSGSYVSPPGLPEAAHCRFGGATFARAGPFAPHFDDRIQALCARDAALHETADGAVFHRDETGRPDQIRLLQAHGALLGRVVGVAEVRPVQLGA